MHKFLKHIWNKIFNCNLQFNIQRHFYILYFGGFISHSKFLPFKLFTTFLNKLFIKCIQKQDSIIQLMNNSCKNSITYFNSNKSFVDIEIQRYYCHEFYYNLFQLLIYMIVYKAQSLINDNEQFLCFIDFIQKNINLKELIFCKSLNPLYYCDPIVNYLFIFYIYLDC